jgi:hypothetical protein
MYQPIDEQTQWLMAYHAQLPRPQDVPDLPEGDALAAEWRAYKREVGRLLAEGQVGRFALVRGDAVVSLWDTRNDAIQAGSERFGHTPFLVQEIQPFLRPLRVGYRRLCQP